MDVEGERDNGLSPAELSGGMMLSGYTTAFVSAFRRTGLNLLGAWDACTILYKYNTASR